MNCPSCGSRQVGHLPTGHYFCWSCCVQFAVGDNGPKVYELTEDGALVPVSAVSGAAGGSAAPDITSSERGR